MKQKLRPKCDFSGSICIVSVECGPLHHSSVYMSLCSVPTTTQLYGNACCCLLWKSGWNSAHEIKRRTPIAIRPIVSHLYGYWVVPLAVWSRQSSHSQDAISLTGAAAASSGNYLLTMCISLGWQSCCRWVWWKGRAHFLQPKWSVAAGPEFLPILWSVSCSALVFSSFRWCEKCQRSRMSRRQTPGHWTKPEAWADSQEFIRSRVSHREAGFKNTPAFLCMPGKYTEVMSFSHRANCERRLKI